MRLLLFQYPRSDRRRCNVSFLMYLPPGVIAFSILGRIGGDATSGNLGRTSWTIKTFSILGRIGGDATKIWEARSPSDLKLSVSSVGSEAMQLAHLCAAHLCLHIPFSILGRIGGDATCFHRGPGDLPLLLSVSSVGSEAMQRTGGKKCTIRSSSLFQYPRSDRRRCNVQEKPYTSRAG